MPTYEYINVNAAAAEAATPTVAVESNVAANATETAKDPVNTETAVKKELLTNPPEKEKMSKQFEALALKERNITSKEKALKEQIQRVEKFEEMQKELEHDPIGFVLKYRNMSIDDALANHLNASKNGPPKKDKVELLEEKWAQLEKEKEELAKKAQEQETLNKKSALDKQIDTHLNEIVNSMASHISTNKDNYELVLANADEATKLFKDEVLLHTKKLNRDLTKEEHVYILDAVENYLLDNAKKSLEKVKGVKKLGLVKEKEEEKQSSSNISSLPAKKAPQLTNNTASAPVRYQPKPKDSFEEHKRAMAEKYKSSKLTW